MDTLKNYEIVFSGLKNGLHSFEYEIQDTFFNLFEVEKDFRKSSIKAVVTLDKKETMLVLHFKLDGKVEVDCDSTNEPFDLSIRYESNIIIKFGENYQDDGDDVVVIPFNEYHINTAQWLYEFVLLAIPVKKVHPKVLDGTMESTVLQQLVDLQPTEKSKIQENEPIDPRWDQLKKLLN